MKYFFGRIWTPIFANDVDGDLDIKYTTFSPEEEEFIEPVDLVFLNTDYNDAYPCLTDNKQDLYFTSDRDGDYDIFQVELGRQLPVEFADSTDRTIRKVDILSSEYDDKCPYIRGDVLIFVSNRPGGKGGYDIYYSKRLNGNWSEPINLERVNTEHDEFRPVIFKYYDFKNDLMIFSSNRPGGKGGFDLYCAGF